MVERICSTCQHGNPLDDRFCGKCDAPLERQLPARRTDSSLMIAGHQLPVSWQQLGKTVAISVIALAAEAGLAWLRRRTEVGPSVAAAPLVKSQASTPSTQNQTTAITRTGAQIVTIISQRVVEVWESDEGHHHIVERHFWRQTKE